jgi:hypothetical protein
MKKTLLLLIGAFVGMLTTSNVNAQVLNDFESGSPAVVTKYGASYSTVANPLSAGLNTTENCGKIGRTTSNWWEMIYFPVSFSVPANTKYYVHILVKYDAQPDVAIRVDATTAGGDGSADIRAMNTYSNIGQWQDLVFEVNGGSGGRNVIQIIFLADLGFNNNPAVRVLNNTDKFAYIDEIVVNTNPLPRGTTYIVANNLWDFEPGTTGNIGGVTTYADGNNPVTYPTANPLKNGLNNTNNSGKRVAAASTNWYTGFEYSFSSPVQIDDNHKYLHALVMVPQAGQKVVFDVKVGSTKVISDRVHTIPTANEWHDVVLDVSTYPFISGGAIKCGHWDGTAVGEYYVDELYLDNNPNPRVDVTTSLNGLKNARMIFAQGNTIIIEPNEVCTANIFDISGHLIAEKQVIGRTEIKVSNPGIYIVNIANESTRVAVVF